MGLVVGFPKNLRCLYVDQLEGVDLEQSAVEVVVGADVAAQRAQRDSEALEAALEGGDGADVARTLRQLQLDRLVDEVGEARQTAERRSGERGLAARQALVAAEARLEAAQQALGEPVGAQEMHGALGVAQVGPFKHHILILKLTTCTSYLYGEVVAAPPPTPSPSRRTC